jgi:hypothetical protein
MDIPTNTQEAKPAQNTAQPPINPMQFDESALAKLLKTRFSGEEEKASAVERQVPEPEATSVDDQAEDAEPTAEQTDAQAESPEQEVLSETEENSDEDSLGYRKRIDKLTRQKKEALEKAEALERELNDAKTKLEQTNDRPTAVQSAADPFADVWEVSKLNDEWSKARNLKRWCEDNIDGCEVEGKEYSAEDVKQIKRRVEDAIDLHIPTRARFLQNYQQIKPIAETLYPWWKDRSATEYTEAQAVLRQLPQIASLPEYQVLVGDFIAGRKLRLEKESAKGKPSATRPLAKAPSQPGRPTAIPAKKDAAKVGLDNAKLQFKKSGTTTELAQVLKRML